MQNTYLTAKFARPRLHLAPFCHVYWRSCIERARAVLTMISQLRVTFADTVISYVTKFDVRSSVSHAGYRIATGEI